MGDLGRVGVNTLMRRVRRNIRRNRPRRVARGTARIANHLNQLQRGPGSGLTYPPGVPSSSSPGRQPIPGAWGPFTHDWSAVFRESGGGGGAVGHEIVMTSPRPPIGNSGSNFLNPGLLGLGRVSLKKLQQRELKLEHKIEKATTNENAARVARLEQRKELTQQKIARRLAPASTVDTGPGPTVPTTPTDPGPGGGGGGGDPSGGGGAVDTDIDSSVPIDSLTEGTDPNAITPQPMPGDQGSTPVQGGGGGFAKALPVLGIGLAIWFLTRKKKRHR